MALVPCKRCQATLVARGYCDACKSAAPATIAEQRRGSSAARGYGAAWQKARVGFLAAHPICVDPDRRHIGEIRSAVEVDHITPHRGDRVLFWDSRNWQGLCKSCHSFKTAKHDGAFGRNVQIAAFALVVLLLGCEAYFALGLG
ncbi:MAG TPA: HNH endonuclease signature motif containing protein [Terracidiphilus sp.]|nr:HNH endonuclease signature motif containing protein [Terracidiphilus sp.]